MMFSSPRFAGPAVRAAQRLHLTLGEIASGVQSLQASVKPAAPVATGLPESAAKSTDATEPTAEPEASAVVASKPPTKDEPEASESAPVAQPPVLSDAPAPANTGRATAIGEVSPAFPAVPDLRPELAAFVAAWSQQHEATAQALRQVTGLCQQQQRQSEQLAQKLEELCLRVRVQACRP